MSHARTSPAGPRGGFSCVRPPVMIRFLYMIGGELRPLLPGRPCRISGVFRLTMPLSPKASFGSPVFASSENSRPSPVPKTICGGVLRVAGPVLDAARRRIAGRHLEDPHLLARRRVERDDAAVGRGDVHHAVDDERRGLADGEAGAAASRGRVPGARRRRRRAGGGGRWLRGAACDTPTRPPADRRWPGVICVSGEKRMPPGSWP